MSFILLEDGTFFILLESDSGPPSDPDKIVLETVGGGQWVPHSTPDERNVWVDEPPPVEIT